MSDVWLIHPTCNTNILYNRSIENIYKCKKLQGHNKVVNVFFLDRIDVLEYQTASVSKALKGISVITH